MADMDVDIWKSGALSDSRDAEYDLDTSYPRLASAFYRKLRKRYPRAFRRRTINGTPSETSSVCSEILGAPPSGDMLSPRGHGSVDHLRDGRPPRHPCRASDEAARDDMGIVGTPRTRQRGALYGAGSQYSSTTSLYGQIVENSRGMTFKSESMVSLRERLLRNQESWDRLLSDDPTRRLRARGRRTDPSRLGPCRPPTPPAASAQSEPGPPSSEAAKRQKLLELEEALEKMAAGLDGRLTSTEPLRVDVAAGGPSKAGGGDGAVSRGTAKALPPSRRFASPDSHDSAVEMDSASLPSNPSSENTPPSGLPFAEGRPPGKPGSSADHVRVSGRPVLRASVSLPPPTPNAVDRPSRARCRTPKLRSRGASPLLQSEPNSSASSVNGDTTPRSRLCSPDQRLFSPGGSTCSVHQRLGADPNKNSKDSDADSGISQPVVKQPILIESEEPFYLTDDDTNSVIFIDSANHEDLQVANGSIHQMDHGLVHNGSRLHAHFSSSESNVYSGPRSSSDDRRREVKFEDEVYANHSDKRTRTLSQSAVNVAQGTGAYSNIVAGYGVPPGFDPEQRNNFLPASIYGRGAAWQASHDLEHQQSGQNRSRTKRALLMGASGMQTNKVTSAPLQHPTSDRHKASLVPPPRTKRKQHQKAAQGADDAKRPQQPRRIQHASGQSNLESVISKSETELNSELAGYNMAMDGVDFDNIDNSQKTSKLPWKKNKGRFTPTKEVEKMHYRIDGLSRSSSKTSLASSFAGDLKADAGDASVLPSADKAAEQKANFGGQRRPVSKPPPAPKPGYLSKQHSSPQQPDCQPEEKRSTERPSLPPKPSIEDKAAPVKPVAKTVSELQKQDSRENVASDSSKTPEPHGLPATSNSNNADTAGRRKSEKKAKKEESRNHFSEYETIDADLASETALASERPHECVSASQSQRLPNVEQSCSILGQDGEEFHEVAVDVPSGCELYASVDYTKKSHPRRDSDAEVQYINYDDDFHEEEGPPLPERGYNSNLQKTKGLSDSNNSLTSSFGSLKSSARKKFAKLRKALSLDKVDKAGVNDDNGNNVDNPASIPPSPSGIGNSKFKRSSSLKSVTEVFGIGKKAKEKKRGAAGNTADSQAPSQRKPPKPPSGFRKNPSVSGPEMPETPQHFRPIGNIKAIHEDGSRVVELIKPPHGPFGFYIARASAKYNHGIIISRLSDALPEHFFAGLIAVGDEVIEINGLEVQDMRLEEVYDMMASEDRLTLRTMPLPSRSEI